MVARRLHPFWSNLLPPPPNPLSAAAVARSGHAVTAPGGRNGFRDGGGAVTVTIPRDGMMPAAVGSGGSGVISPACRQPCDWSCVERCLLVIVSGQPIAVSP